MINLLPPEQKRKLLAEQKFRLTLILELLSLLFLTSLALVLFSIQIYISGLINAQKILADLEERQFQETQVQDFEKEIRSINKTLSNLNSFYQKQPRITNLLERISNNIPSEINLNSLQFTLPSPTEKGEKYAFKVTVSGSAPTREILYKFKKNLEAEEGFKEIYLAIASWIEPTDFNLTFKIQ